MTVTPTQYWQLEQWAKGVFDADYHPGYVPPRDLHALDVAEQPAMLDRGTRQVDPGRVQGSEDGRVAGDAHADSLRGEFGL